jgi:type I restriction enzyme, S subunit
MSLLEQHFNVAFAAPDGIKKLRELILTLAMQGKLVPQDPNDEAAIELLRSINLEKKRLVKEGKIKQPKPFPEVEPEEVPYDLPDRWEWVRIRNIGHDWGQKTPDQLFTYIDVGSINNTIGIICDDVQLLESSDAPSRARKIVRQGTVIYSTVRPYLLNIAIVEQEYIHEPIASTAFAIVHPYSGIVNRFIYYYLKSPVFIRFVESTMKGVAYPAINDGDFFRGVFPLPPLAEQRRIVAKIDQLMARCDELEKLRIDRSQRLLTVHTAALDRLLTAKDSSEFSTAWSFITQHFGELYSVKENVVELRKTILQLAVMGKLVQQDPNDEPASELLRSIELEKQRLVKEGKIKKSKPLPKIKPEEIPYKLPKEWVWARLGEISLFSDSGWSPQCLSEPRSGQEWGVLKVSAVSWGEFRHEENKALPPGIEAKPECEVRVGDFLISRANTEELVARSVLVKESPVCLMMSDKIVRFKLSQKIEKDFINFANLSQFSREYYASNASGTSSSMKNISREVMNNLPIPLPPLAEQRRIVEKIDRLMGMCDRLERSIESGKGKQTDLLNALMSQV